MNKLRPIRFKNMAVDMTAMCDVAFLLLCFFVVTSKFKQWEPMKINVPITQKNISDRDYNTAIISIAGNRVMYQMEGSFIRIETLTSMAQKYGLAFSSTEKEKFINSPIVGAPICDLKQYDDQYMDWTSNISRPGIPYANGALDENELFDWIKQSRLADRALFSKDLRIIIEADKDVSYPVVKRVIAILQKQKVNKFSFLTESKKQG